MPPLGSMLLLRSPLNRICTTVNYATERQIAIAELSAWDLTFTRDSQSGT